MHVVGTAGHVDHGKSTLVAALTGIHPDRLKEEQQREMTIDLGFAWLPLPNSETVGIVDVPGHRDFIENMLAGVGGIDAAIFVIAADEGVMPQTREHLAILDLLQIPAGVIALTKIDLVDDPDWLDLVELDIRQVLNGTVLQDSPLVRVSARTGVGLDELKSALQVIVTASPPRPDLSRPRLPVDRVFSMTGFGTVVTGTLQDGIFRTGDDVEILPAGIHGRIRGLQTHKRKEQTAHPGSRTAINLSGVEMDQVRRGDVISLPGKYKPTQRMDVHFRMLRDASRPLLHSTQVKLFLGAAEVPARVRILGNEFIKPGEEGFIQLEMESAVVAVRGDHFIIRWPSPGETIGGGEVVDPYPARRHKRFDAAVIEKLETLRHGTPEDVILQAALALGLTDLRSIYQKSRLTVGDAVGAIDLLFANGAMVQLEEGSLDVNSECLVAAQTVLQTLLDKASKELNAYHRTYPLRKGMLKEELKSRLHSTTRPFNALMTFWISQKNIVDHGMSASTVEHQVVFSLQQKKQADSLLETFKRSPFSPPSVKESQAVIGEELLNAVIDQGELVQVSAEVVFRKADYDFMLRFTQDHLKTHETITVAEFRDGINTSRRYALAFLEHLDTVGVTVRDGDVRRLKSNKN